MTTNSFACTTPSDDLTINSDTTLCGGDYQINDSGSQGIIRINSNNVNLYCNNTYIHGNRTGTGTGIYIGTKSNINLTNCNISNYIYGIYITTANTININGSTICTNENGIYLNTVQRAYIINNNISNNSGAGLYHGAIFITNSNSNDSVIINNTIEDNSRGIRIFSGNYNNITSNKIRRNSNNNLVLDNTNAKYTLLETNLIEPSTTYGGYATTSANNIYADWTAGPLSNYLTDFPTITEALSISSSNDIIYAFSNEYSECPAITKTITLTGEERDSTKITCSSGTALNITGNNAIFANFTLSTQGSASPALAITANSTVISNISIKNQANGIKIDNADNNTLDNLKLENLTYSINITSSATTTINMSTITNGTIRALDSLSVHIKNTTFTQQSYSFNQYTTYFENTNNSEIVRNTYTNIQSENMRIAKSAEINITENTFTAATTAYNIIYLENTTHTQIQRNTINKSDYAITAYSTDNITIDSNTINSTTETGIMLMNTNNTRITNNTLNTAKKAIHLDSGNTNTMYNNTIRNMTETGIKISPNSQYENRTYINNTIERNTITNSASAISARNTYSTKITENTITNISGTRSLTLENSTEDNITYNTFNIGSTAISLSNTNQTLIKANTFSNHASSSIYFNWSSSIYNTGNTIKDNNITGRGTDTGLEIMTNIGITITNNTISDTSTSIRAYNTNYSIITNNTIAYASSYGIWLQFSRQNTIDRNTIRQSKNNAIYTSGNPSVPDTNNTIKNNNIYNATRGINLQYITNSTISNNTIDFSEEGLYILDSQRNNITENTFKNNINYGLDISDSSSTNNSLWINNFSDTSNTFRENYNTYCVLGLDNYYRNSSYDNPPYSCYRSFTPSFNDTAIYAGETINYTINTSYGESNYTLINITINSRNYTTNLTSGTSIKGLWTYTYTNTTQIGKYNATVIYYNEADNDKGTYYASTSFDVMNLSIITNITPKTANIGATIRINATIENNATNIDYVRSDIYWNNTLIDQKTNTSFEKINDTKRIYRLYTSSTPRSGTYNVSTTVVAGQNKSYEDTFTINYGTANITINSAPQLIAYGIISVQNISIKALEGDLKNITLTFRSSNESIINITPASQTIPYLNNSSTQDITINLTATGIGTPEINITATPENGTANSKKKSIEVRRINLTTEIYPKTASVTSPITITANVQNNVSEIRNVSADIYWNTILVGTIPLVFGSSTEITGYGNNQNYMYSGTTTRTNRSGTYTVNITAVSTTNATGSDTYSINYGTANISIPASPGMLNKGTEKNQSFNITAVNGDLENITITYASNDSPILNITTENQLIPYMNSSETRQLNISIAAINTSAARINITASPEKGTSDTKLKNMTIKELKIDTYLNTTTINITNAIRIYANITGNITAVEYVLANITWNSSVKQQLLMSYMHYDSAEEKHIYSRIITSTDRSGNYTVTTTVKAEITANDTETFFVNYGQATINLYAEPYAISKGNQSEQTYTITASGGDLVNVSSTISFNDTLKLNVSATEDITKQIAYISNTNTSAIIWDLNATDVGSVILNITTDTQSDQKNASKQITITGGSDNETPSVYETWTQYETQRRSIFNLMDTAYVYANVSDNYAVKTVQANITTINKTGEIITLERVIELEGIYKGQFTNTTDLDQYNIRIIASDGTNTNSTETQNFNTTDIYPLAIIQSESLYNRGENATITIAAYGINGNLVTGFNTSLNITYESNTTILLDNENTDTTYYYINTSVLGIHNMSTNITKNGNIGLNTSEFNVTNILNMTYQTDIEKYPPTTPIRRFLLYVNYGRGDEYFNDINATLYCYNNTQENQAYVPLEKDTSNIYTYQNDNGPPECFPPNSFCTEYNIEANITDAYNNTGTKSFTLNSYCYQQSASSSSGGSSSASSGGGPGILSGIPEKIKEYIFGNQTNRTIVNDFAFTLNKKEAAIKQGENITIIGTLDNIGETDRLIETEITQDCCNVRTENTRYFIQSKNKEDIPIHIHNSLKTIPGEYLINVVMRSGNITKRETIRITIEKNPLITDLENLETKTPGLEQDIESYAIAGVDVAYLKDAMNDLKTLIKAARESIERDDIENLKKNLDAAKKKFDNISLEFLKLNTMKWLSENKYNIVAAGITTIFLSYMLIYFMIPYYYLKKELTGLLTKEVEMKYAEKAIQKQYFMRQLDERSFNRLLSDEHGKLLDTRSHIKQIEEKITLLKRGKLNIMDKEHSKYFILKKIAPRQKTIENMTIHREEELKSLKNQEYNINQSSKEAEKKFYSEIITQEELEQILNSNNSKLEAVRKKQMEIISKDHPAEIQKTTPKRDIIKEIRKKYDQYWLNKEEKHIEAKIKELEKDEHNLDRTNEEIKAKKDNIENEIETLKKEEILLKEKEKNI